MPRLRKKAAIVQHDKQSRPSPSNKNVKEDSDDNVPDNQLGQYITKEYELLRLVLSYLPLRDLYAAARVCTSWKAAVECIQRSRGELHWLFWHCQQKTPLQEEVPHQMFSKYFFSEPQLCLIFMTHLLSDYQVICQNSSAPCPCPLGDGRPCSSWHRVINYVKAELPSECPCIAIEGSGIVGSTHDLSDTLEIEEGFNGYSGIFVPKVPGVSVTTFLLTKAEADQISRKILLTPSEVEKVTKLPPREPIQCLLLFCRNRHSPAIDVIVKSLEARQTEQFAIGGGLFDTAKSCGAKRRIHMVGVAFSGEGVHAASTILGHSVTTERDVEAKMEQFRSHCLPAPQSIGYMFACVGRGVDWYQQDNVESRIFCRHFPSTPLVGFFGNGEIGQTFLPAVTREDANNRFPRTEVNPHITTQHSYSTVFVYVSFKPKA